MRLWADFNDIEDDDYVVVDLDSSEIANGENDLHEGMRVDLSDGAHECQGEVVAVDLANRLVRVRLDWATWRSTISRITMESDINTIVFVHSHFEYRPPVKIEQSEGHPVTISR